MVEHRRFGLSQLHSKRQVGIAEDKATIICTDSQRKIALLYELKGFRQFATKSSLHIFILSCNPRVILSCLFAKRAVVY
jgi:hypothetical protein